MHIIIGDILKFLCYYSFLLNIHITEQLYQHFIESLVMIHGIPLSFHSFRVLIRVLTDYTIFSVKTTVKILTKMAFFILSGLSSDRRQDYACRNPCPGGQHHSCKVHLIFVTFAVIK